MKKIKLYRYLGKNGVLDSPILFEEMNYVLRYRLVAAENKILKNGDKKFYMIDVNADEVKNWVEVEDNQD